MNLNEIAKKLHVSRWTVSRAMNNNGYVNEEKKKLILKYLAKVKYVPNFHASGLAGKNPRIVGLIVPEGVVRSLDYFLAETIKYLTLALEKKGYYLMLFIDENHDSGKIMRLQESKALAGAVIFSPTKNDADKMKKFAKKNLPSVIIFSHHKDIDSFACDNEQGGYIVTKFLIQKGKKRIAFIHGHPQWVDSADRFKGYLRALDEYGIKYNGNLVSNGFFNLPEGKKAAEELISLPRRPDAIFAANDNMAIGAMWAAAERKLAVPDDIAVAGYDGISDSMFTTPRLTTVSQPIKGIVNNSVERLIDKLEHKSKAKPVLKLYVPGLVIRNSV